MPEFTCSSWGDYLKQYDTQRKTLSWSNEDFLPVQKMGTRERALKQREVDPVTMQFRDAAREQERVRVREAKQDEKRRTWLTSRATSRNILVNTTNPVQQQQYATLRQSVAPAPPRERNIISHLQNGADHTYCPTIYNDTYMTEKVHVRTRPLVEAGKLLMFDRV